MFGAFRSTIATLGGLVWKRRFRLTDTQKYRHRKRLRAVDEVVDTLVESGVKLRALELARRAPKESEMSPLEKYWVASKRESGALEASVQCREPQTGAAFLVTANPVADSSSDCAMRPRGVEKQNTASAATRRLGLDFGAPWYSTALDNAVARVDKNLNPDRGISMR
ncbi:hypothetical protein SpCBS45565_g03640 [Spizellomyces sp. 'palustris']|nr:hypothetical protein SpCBS45565_g03640 [Spizellomyces sp. 'palustris']